MAATILQSPLPTTTVRRVRPSVRHDDELQPFTLDQELSPFGKWVGAPVWVPPKDASADLARSMLKQSGACTSRRKSWERLITEHRSRFTQVREIELSKESIRLPQGKLFVSVTERDQFDQITDKIPNCVQTRLDEFLAGPGKRPGVRVYYLKPLCVEVGDDLIFTTRAEIEAVIEKIQAEIFSEYRRKYLPHRAKQLTFGAIDAGLTVPKLLWKRVIEQRKRTIDAYHAKLEFNRRKAAWNAAQCRRQFRTDDCSFNELLSLTSTPERADVVEQYAAENELSEAEKYRLLKATAATLPWFATLSLSIYYVSTLVTAITLAPPILVCDPAFVAEMPGSDGVVLKIGHFDEVRGVTHVEI